MFCGLGMLFISYIYHSESCPHPKTPVHCENLQTRTTFVNDTDAVNLIIILHVFDAILVDSYIPATVGSWGHCSAPDAIDEEVL